MNLDESLLFRRVELAVESDDLILLVRTWAQGAKLGQSLPSKVSYVINEDTKIVFDYNVFIQMQIEINWMDSYNFQESGETALHLAITKKSSLPIVDFLIHNSGASDKKTKNTLSAPLHYCAFYGRTEPTKLLLRAGVDLQVQDSEKLTALEVARQRGHKAVEDLVSESFKCK